MIEPGLRRPLQAVSAQPAAFLRGGLPDHL